MTANPSANTLSKQPAASTCVKTMVSMTTAVATTPTATTTATSTSTPTSSAQPVVKLFKLSANAPSSCDIQNNQEQIAEKAKQVIINLLYFILLNNLLVGFC